MSHALATTLLHSIELGLAEHKLALAHKQLVHMLAYCNLDREPYYVDQSKLIINQMKLKNWEPCSALIQQTARRAITDYSKREVIE